MAEVVPVDDEKGGTERGGEEGQGEGRNGGWVLKMKSNCSQMIDSLRWEIKISSPAPSRSLVHRPRGKIVKDTKPRRIAIKPLSVHRSRMVTISTIQEFL